MPLGLVLPQLVLLYSVMNQSINSLVRPPWGWVLPQLILLYSVCINYAFSWGPVVWVMCAELIPLKYRAVTPGPAQTLSPGPAANPD